MNKRFVISILLIKVVEQNTIEENKVDDMN